MWLMEGNRKRKAEAFNCEKCDKEFLRRQRVPEGKTKAKYCSKACAQLSSRSREQRTCWTCSKVFELPISRVEGKKVFFCTRSCKDEAQKLTSGCSEVMPEHYGCGNKNSVSELLFERGCQDCGENRRFMLNLHHVDGNRRNNCSENWEIVCCNHHTMRHLRLVDGEWVYSTAHLTPRDVLKKMLEEEKLKTK